MHSTHTEQMAVEDNNHDSQPMAPTDATQPPSNNNDAAAAAAGSAGGEAPPPATKKAKTGPPLLPASVVVQFQSTQGERTGPQVDLPTDSTPAQLEQLVNELRKAQGQDGEEAAAAGKVPYSCYVNDVEVTDSLRETLQELGVSSEGVITVSYQPLAVFRVRPVVRCTDTMPGHTEVRVCVCIAHQMRWRPDG